MPGTAKHQAFSPRGAAFVETQRFTFLTDAPGSRPQTSFLRSKRAGAEPLGAALSRAAIDTSARGVDILDARPSTAATALVRCPEPPKTARPARSLTGPVLALVSSARGVSAAAPKPSSSQSRQRPSRRVLEAGSARPCGAVASTSLDAVAPVDDRRAERVAIDEVAAAALDALDLPEAAATFREESSWALPTRCHYAQLHPLAAIRELPLTIAPVELAAQRSDAVVADEAAPLALRWETALHEEIPAPATPLVFPVQPKSPRASGDDASRLGRPRQTVFVPQNELRATPPPRQAPARMSLAPPPPIEQSPPLRRRVSADLVESGLVQGERLSKDSAAWAGAVQRTTKRLPPAPRAQITGRRQTLAAMSLLSHRNTLPASRPGTLPEGSVDDMLRRRDPALFSDTRDADLAGTIAAEALLVQLRAEDGPRDARDGSRQAKAFADQFEKRLIARQLLLTGQLRYDDSGNDEVQWRRCVSSSLRGTALKDTQRGIAQRMVLQWKGVTDGKPGAQGLPCLAAKAKLEV